MKHNRREDMNKAPTTRRCPVCNELIPDNVSVCPYCDEDIDNDILETKQLFRTRTHWIVFVPWLLISSVLIALILFFDRMILWEETQIQIELLIAHITTTLLCMICVYETICRIALFITSSYVILSDGINLNRAKFLGKITDDIELSHITAVLLENFYEKLNCGTIVIYTNDGKQKKLRAIKQPLEFKKTIDNLLNEMSDYEY